MYSCLSLCGWRTLGTRLNGNAVKVMTDDVTAFFFIVVTEKQLQTEMTMANVSIVQQNDDSEVPC